MNEEREIHREPVGYGVYFLTWFALLLLTSITTTVAGMRFGHLSVFVALVIAGVKASIVLYIFMHLRYESGLFRIMVLIVLAVLVLFIGLTFVDVLFR
jgi:cytochrome c oxidase subunit 4